MLLQAHYDFNYGGHWRGCSSDGCGKKVWAYDKKGNQVLGGQADWPSTSLNGWRWVKKIVNNYQYDHHMNLVLEATIESSQDYDGNFSKFGGKKEYSYDENGNQLGKISYHWDDSNKEDWVPRQKHETSYDANNQIIGQNRYEWGINHWFGSASAWDNNYYASERAKITYKVDSNGRILEAFQHRWIDSLRTWE